MTHNIKCLQFYIADKIKKMFFFKWSENSRSGFYFILFDFFCGGDAEAAEGHWEEWECQDKDDQWGRNAGVLLS